MQNVGWERLLLCKRIWNGVCLFLFFLFFLLSSVARTPLVWYGIRKHLRADIHSAYNTLSIRVNLGFFFYCRHSRLQWRHVTTQSRAGKIIRTVRLYKVWRVNQSAFYTLYVTHICEDSHPRLNPAVDRLQNATALERLGFRPIRHPVFPAIITMTYIFGWRGPSRWCESSVDWMWRGRCCTPTGGAKSKYLGRGHFFPFLKKGPSSRRWTKIAKWEEDGETIARETQCGGCQSLSDFRIRSCATKTCGQKFFVKVFSDIQVLGPSRAGSFVFHRVNSWTLIGG